MSNNDIIIAQGKYSTLEEFVKNSPIPLDLNPLNNLPLLLQTLFNDNDWVWLGHLTEPQEAGTTVKTAGEWIAAITAGNFTAPSYMTPNPLIDEDILAAYRFSAAETKSMTLPAQIAFWSAVDLPIVAIITTRYGLQAWIDVRRFGNAQNYDEWYAMVSAELAPYNFVTTYTDPLYPAKLPGYYNAARREWQRLIWLSESGKRVSG